ncbi:MAG: 50S ribosomal protein L10 [Christensenellaceae bacterium]|nr:50S ribosomal protein L10 [Christensenellaceae bacterium]
MASEKNIAQKAEVVAEIKKIIADAKTFILVDYRGITVAQDLTLRNEFRKEGVSYKIYKNTLINRALKELGIEGFEKALNGTTALAASSTDPVAPARIIVKKGDEFKKLEVKCGLVENKFSNNAQIISLSKLPSREILLSQLLGLLQAPIAQFARALNLVAEQKA